MKSNEQILEETRLKVHLHSNSKMYGNGTTRTIYVSRRMGFGAFMAFRWNRFKKLASRSGIVGAVALVPRRRSTITEQFSAKIGQRFIARGGT